MSLTVGVYGTVNSTTSVALGHRRHVQTNVQNDYQNDEQQRQRLVDGHHVSPIYVEKCLAQLSHQCWLPAAIDGRRNPRHIRAVLKTKASVEKRPDRRRECDKDRELELRVLTKKLVLAENKANKKKADKAAAKAKAKADKAKAKEDRSRAKKAKSKKGEPQMEEAEKDKAEEDKAEEDKAEEEKAGDKGKGDDESVDSAEVLEENAEDDSEPFCCIPLPSRLRPSKWRV